MELLNREKNKKRAAAKIYFFYFFTFLSMLMFIIFSISSRVKIAELMRKQANIEKIFFQVGIKLNDSAYQISDYDDSVIPLTSNKFIKPSQKKKNTNWPKSLIFQKKVRQNVENWIIAFKHLRKYRKNNAPFTETNFHALFYGPAGTGKSFLAETFAINESYAYAIVDFKTKLYVGTGLLKMDEIFEEAKAILKQQEFISTLRKEKDNKPLVVIINEIDSVGIKNENGRDATSITEANGLQNLIDKFSSHKLNVIFIGTTNSLNLLNPPLLRSGRFSRLIEVDYPSEEEIILMTNSLKKFAEKTWENWEKTQPDKEGIRWGEDFWRNIEEINKNISEKNQQTGLIYQDLQEAIIEAISLSFKENLKVLIPNPSDYKAKLEELVLNKKKLKKSQHIISL